jgi:phage/plasmid primase-like uncharacterized protein
MNTAHTERERIEAALRHIPATSPRDLWFSILAAIKSEYGEAGRDLAETWSQTDPSFNAQDFRDVWKSIKPGGGVKIGTLFRVAKQHGWRDDQPHIKPTAEQIAQRQREADKRTQKENLDLYRKREQAAKTAQTVYRAAPLAPANNPYQVRKGVSPEPMLKELPASELAKILNYAPQSDGQPLTGNILIAPIMQGGQLASLEFIDESGRKSALSGGAKAGGYTPLQAMPKGNGKGLTLLIGEGLASCMTAKQATGYLAFAALSSGNLLAVAKELRSNYPQADVVILGELLKSSGEIDPHAIQAAEAIGARLAVPEFGKERHQEQTDINDFSAKFGADAVQKLIDAATNSTNSYENSVKSTSYDTNTSTNTLRTLTNSLPAPEPVREWDTVIAPPVATEEMFYGLLGQFAKAAALDTEVNPVAAMASAMTWLSAAMGRNIGLFAGNTWHGIRLNTVHVGRTSSGRKGDALGLLKRVIKAMEKDATYAKLLPMKHDGGLSSREGLAMLIHDGYKLGKEEVAAIEDKRLFILEEEFANVLAQCKRDGNTLSACIRGLFDGVSIQPAAKTGIWASKPHIAIHGCITPTELRAKMSEGELSNGFANRFLIFWAERTCIEAFPRSAPDAEVNGYAKKLAEIIDFGLSDYPTNQDTITLKLTMAARDAYRTTYTEYNTQHPGGERITGLLARRSPLLLRMAGLFSITDKSHDIDVKHIRAAHAWMTYFAQSVHFIFPPTAGALEHEALRNEQAEKLCAWLTGKNWKSRTEITKGCFSGNTTAHTIDGALQALALEKRIDRREVKTKTVKRTEYRAVSREKNKQFVDCSLTVRNQGLTQVVDLIEENKQFGEFVQFVPPHAETTARGAL